MSKRFTETGKWEKEWFQDLDPVLKCLWSYICDKCDSAGVWDPNWKIASFLIGKKVTIESLKVFGGRVVELASGKIWLSSFIEFQYGKLSKDCRPHLKIFETLNKHGIDYHEDQGAVLRARVGYVSEGKRKAIYERDGQKCVYCGSGEDLQPDHIIARKNGGTDEINNLVTACARCNTLKNDKPVSEFLEFHPEKQRVSEYLDRVSAKLDTLLIQGKDKEEEKDKEGGGAGGGAADKARGTLKEIRAFCAEIGLPPSDGESCFHKWEGKGWKNGGDKIKCWRSTIRSWKAAGYLPSQKNNGGSGKDLGDTKKGEWLAAKPVIAIPAAEAERIAAEARKQAEEFRRTQTERTA